MKKNNDKPYWKESLECYLSIFTFIFLFIGTVFLSGQLTGTDWISYFRQLSWEVNVDELKEIFLLRK